MNKFFIIPLLITIFISGCKEKNKKTSSVQDEINQIIMNFQLVENVKGATDFVLNANKALVYDTQTIVYKVTLEFYKNGVPYAELISDSGQLFTNTNDMCAYGNVKVTGIQNATLETDLLNWSNKRQTIYTPSNVLINKERKIIKGKDFESDPGLTNIKLKETYGYGK